MNEFIKKWNRPTTSVLFFILVIGNYMVYGWLMGLKPVDIPAALWAVFAAHFASYNYGRSNEKVAGKA